jgi:hypothetical protein
MPDANINSPKFKAGRRRKASSREAHLLLRKFMQNLHVSHWMLDFRIHPFLLAMNLFRSVLWLES